MKFLHNSELLLKQGRKLLRLNITNNQESFLREILDSP